MKLKLDIIKNDENVPHDDIVKNDENVPHLEITEVVLVHCNIFNNDYQQDSKVLFAFVLSKPFGSSL